MGNAQSQVQQKQLKHSEIRRTQPQNLGYSKCSYEQKYEPPVLDMNSMPFLGPPENHLDIHKGFDRAENSNNKSSLLTIDPKSSFNCEQSPKVPSSAGSPTSIETQWNQGHLKWPRYHHSNVSPDLSLHAEVTSCSHHIKNRSPTSSHSGDSITSQLSFLSTSCPSSVQKYREMMNYCTPSNSPTLLTQFEASVPPPVPPHYVVPLKPIDQEFESALAAIESLENEVESDETNFRNGFITPHLSNHLDQPNLGRSKSMSRSKSLNRSNTFNRFAILGRSKSSSFSRSLESPHFDITLNDDDLIFSTDTDIYTRKCHTDVIEFPALSKSDELSESDSDEPASPNHGSSNRHSFVLDGYSEGTRLRVINWEDETKQYKVKSKAQVAEEEEQRQRKSSPEPNLGQLPMWTLETVGNGRRAKVLAVHDGNRRFALNDFVRGDEFCGLIAGFKGGETEASHTVQILLFEEKEAEVLVTSIFKWFTINQLENILKLDDMRIKRAIFHPFRTREVVADLPSNFEFQSALELAETVNSLFNKSPMKKPVPSKTNTSRYHIYRENKSIFGEEIDTESDSDEAFQDSEEESVLPIRKRNQGKPFAKGKKNIVEDHGVTKSSLSSAMAATSLKSPKKQVKKRNERKKSTVKKPGESELIKEARVWNEVITGNELTGDSKVQEKIESDAEDLDSLDYSIQPSTGHKRSHAEVKRIPKTRKTSGATSLDLAISQLHPASDPATYPCREKQYDQLFIALESAISAETGTCIYVSGTPGTGKTSTLREVIGQLYLRVAEKELMPFTFLEINGMKLVHPNAAYEHLWEALGRGQMAASNAMTALESAFSADEDRSKRGVIVVLLDELDQLVTKGQQLMYNFFNWPSLPNSRLVVIAVANTMDLPERMLSNKISSRVGLTRVQFPGYTHDELRQIVNQRLENIDYSRYIEPDALEYATRKVSGVGGDARRVLDFVRLSLETAASQNTFPVKTAHVRDVIVRSQALPLTEFLSSLGITAKTFLCAMLARTRRTDNIEASVHDVLLQASQLVKSANCSNLLLKHLFNNDSKMRLHHFQTALMELIESGILVQQVIKGEATPVVRLMVPVSLIKEHLEKDRLLDGMV